MKNGLYFLFGAVTGSLVAWFVLKDRYERIAQEEIDSVKEAFSKKEDEKSPLSNLAKKVVSTAETFSSFAEATAKVNTEKPPLVNYKKELAANKYDPASMIYVIPPSEFGDIDDYERFTLTYYADGVLTDDNDDIIDDIDETVGSDFVHHFGEYEEDSVYVRNDIRGCDYEILMDLNTYDEVLKTKPKPIRRHDE